MQVTAIDGAHYGFRNSEQRVPDAVDIGRYTGWDTGLDIAEEPDPLPPGDCADDFHNPGKEIAGREIDYDRPLLRRQTQDNADVLDGADMPLGRCAAGLDILDLCRIKRAIAHEFEEPENRVHGVARVAIEYRNEALNVFCFHWNAPYLL